MIIPANSGHNSVRHHGGHRKIRPATYASPSLIRCLLPILTATDPNLHLSPDERRLFGQLFAQADTDKIGVVTGERAVSFFEKTRLPSDVLGEIWQIADEENRGLLTPAGFGIVLRLIGYAQAGRAVSRELALKRKRLLGVYWRLVC